MAGVNKPKVSKKDISQRFNLKELLGEEPTEQQKELFFNLAVDKMVQRTASGKDITGKSNFPIYSEAYASKKGVSRNSVDLILSGDMLSSFEESRTKQRNVLKISIDESQAGKAHGNITGSYGQPRPNKSKARNFFGFSSEKDLADVIGQVKSGKEIAEPQEEESLGGQITNLAALRRAINEEVSLNYEGLDGES